MIETPAPRNDVSDAWERDEYDARNALTQVKGSAQLLRRHLRSPPPHDIPRAISYTEAIEDAADRLVQMVETWRGRVK